MKAAKELKVLKQIAGILSDTSAQLRKVKAFVWASRIVGWVGIFVAAFLIKQSAISPFAGTLIAALGGVGIGFSIYGSMALTQWPVLKGHINEESLNARIKEIET